MRVNIYQRENVYGQLCFTFDQHNAAVFVGSFDIAPFPPYELESWTTPWGEPVLMAIGPNESPLTPARRCGRFYAVDMFTGEALAACKRSK